MDANTSFEEGQHHRDLRQLLVFLFKRVDGALVDFADRFALILSVEVAILERHRELLTLALAEGEDNAGVESLGDDEGDQLAHLLLRSLLLLLLLVFLFLCFLGDGHVVLDHLDGFRKVVLSEHAFLVHH